LDGHNREECLVIGGKTKLVIGGRKNGFLWKDRHDQPAALNFFEINNFEIFSSDFSSHNSKCHVVLHHHTSAYHGFISIIEWKDKASSRGWRAWQE
jgi:hypothetical protein